MRASPDQLPAHRCRPYLLSGAVLLGAALLLGAAVLLIGLYDVSAARPHWKPTAFLLELARERSIDFHSRGIPVPRLEQAAVGEGARLFHRMCSDCHGAPGKNRLLFAIGLYPAPPHLGSPDVQEAGDAALFWIAKNGIKMTGMPSFGITQSDEALWGVVAFVRKLPGMAPESYRRLVAEAERAAPEPHAGKMPSP